MLFIDATDFCHQKKWMRNLCLGSSCIASLPRFHPSLPSATAVMVHTRDQIIQELPSVLQSEEWQAEDTEKWNVTGLIPSVHTLEPHTAAVRQNWMKRDAAVACLTCPVILKIWPEQPGVLRQTSLLTQYSCRKETEVSNGNKDWNHWEDQESGHLSQKGQIGRNASRTPEWAKKLSWKSDLPLFNGKTSLSNHSVCFE